METTEALSLLRGKPSIWVRYKPPGGHNSGHLSPARLLGVEGDQARVKPSHGHKKEELVPLSSVHIWKSRNVSGPFKGQGLTIGNTEMTKGNGFVIVDKSNFLIFCGKGQGFTPDKDKAVKNGVYDNQGGANIAIARLKRAAEDGGLKGIVSPSHLSVIPVSDLTTFAPIVSPAQIIPHPEVAVPVPTIVSHVPSVIEDTSAKSTSIFAAPDVAGAYKALGDAMQNFVAAKDMMIAAKKDLLDAQTKFGATVTAEIAKMTSITAL